MWQKLNETIAEFEARLYPSRDDAEVELLKHLRSGKIRSRGILRKPVPEDVFEKLTIGADGISPPFVATKPSLPQAVDPRAFETTTVDFEGNWIVGEGFEVVCVELDMKTVDAAVDECRNPEKQRMRLIVDELLQFAARNGFHNRSQLVAHLQAIGEGVVEAMVPIPNLPGARSSLYNIVDEALAQCPELGRYWTKKPEQ